MNFVHTQFLSLHCASALPLVAPISSTSIYHVFFSLMIINALLLNLSRMNWVIKKLRVFKDKPRILTQETWDLLSQGLID